MSTETKPARRYTWPPFEPGNEAAVTHGAYSDKLVVPRARELAPTIFESNPHLDPLRDGPAVWRYAMTLARADRINGHLADQDDMVFADVNEGTVHRVYQLLLELEARADKAEERLAIAPLTRAKLGLDQLRGLDLARQWATEQTGGSDA
jgi:hypothetical protein